MPKGDKVQIYRRDGVAGANFYGVFANERRLSLKTKDRAEAIAKYHQLAAIHGLPSDSEPKQAPAPAAAPAVKVASDPDPLRLVGAGDAPPAPDDDADTPPDPDDVPTRPEIPAVPAPPPKPETDAAPIITEAEVKDFAEMIGGLALAGVGLCVSLAGREPGENSPEQKNAVTSACMPYARRWATTTGPGVVLALALIGAGAEQWKNGKPREKLRAVP